MLGASYTAMNSFDLKYYIPFTNEKSRTTAQMAATDLKQDLLCCQIRF